MANKFREGQRIVIERLIPLGKDLPIPPGRYVIAEVARDLLGNARCRIRSLPDEDLEAEVDLEKLQVSAQALEE